MRYRPSYVSRQSGTEKISRVTVATGSTIVLDSSGTCDGERWMAVANALGQRGSKCVAAAPLKSPLMAGSTVCDDYFRVPTILP